MQLAVTNTTKKGQIRTGVDPQFRRTPFVAAILRSAVTLAVLSALLVAAHPALAQTEAVLYNFTGGSDGSTPQSQLVFNNGNIYGTTEAGGLGSGTVFELTSNGSGGWNETVLYNFCSLSNCADGANPTYSYVMFDSAGNMYGTAYSGGANGYGAVWKLTPQGSSWTESVLYSFANNPDGANPVNGLIVDKSGNMYGTTFNGGSEGNGTVYELSPSNGSWTEQVILQIHANYAGLAIDGSGNIYGTNFQNAFKLWQTKSGWKSAAIFTFSGGSNPNGTLVLDSAGNLYGTTYAGSGYGNVFKLIPGTKGKWTRSILYAFGKTSPNHPLDGVVFDTAGNLYGTTTEGGVHNAGDAYELVAGSGTYTFRTLQPFDGENGGQCLASLTLDSSGYVYGTCSVGGVDGYGVVAEFNAHATATTTTITAVPNPSQQGQTVTFTATVTPAPPDGEMITFEMIGQAPLKGGQAVFQTSALPVGYTRVRAIYFGDFNFLNSRSDWVYEHVEQ